MKSLLLILALLQTLFVSPVNVRPIIPSGQEFQHSATHRIFMKDITDGAGCSATAVGPHTILTAGHCFIPAHEMLIDADVVKILSIDWDNNDHLLIRVDHTFHEYLPIVARDFQYSEIVHMWGNPGRSRDVYRIGVFERSEDELNWFLMPGAPGDSGSGILDAKGNVIGVLSVGNQSGEIGAFSLDFAPAQIAAIK